MLQDCGTCVPDKAGSPQLNRSERAKRLRLTNSRSINCDASEAV
jgi:hypothetical protein